MTILPMEQAGDVASRMDVLRDIAAKAWPDGKLTGVCLKCREERKYTWDDAVHMMAYGLPRHCGQRIDLQ